MKLNVRRGFTLAEVLVTVTITAVLAAVVVPSVVNQVTKGDHGAFSSETAAIQTAVTNYAADNRVLPSTFSDLVQQNSAQASQWKGPYLSTAQDLSTATDAFASAGYGITYSPTFSTTACAGGNYLAITPTKLNNATVAGLDTNNTAFQRFYKDVTGATTPAAPSMSVVTGTLQFSTDGSGVISNLEVCLPVSAG